MSRFENGYPEGCGVICHNNGWWAAYDKDGIFFWSGLSRDDAETHLWNHLHANDFWNNVPVVNLKEG